jgi:hypothetical protein
VHAARKGDGSTQSEFNRWVLGSRRVLSR